MKRVWLVALLFLCPSLHAQNLLSNPLDITNAAWLSGGTGCSKTSATTYTTTSAPCSLYQTINVTANTNYQVQFLVSLASGSSQELDLHMYTTGFSSLCVQAVASITSTAVLLNCTANSGVNTQIIFELDLDAGGASVINVSYPSMLPQYPWSLGYYTPYATGTYPALTDIDWNALTHVAMICGEPNADGTVTLYSGFGTAATTLIATAHAHGVKALYSLSACQTGTTHFTAAITNHEATFITNIMSTVNTYGFDGVDIDDEETWNAGLMTTFLGDLRAQLNTNILTFPAGDFTYAKWDPAHAAYMDRVFIQTYDFGSGTYTTISWFNSPLHTYGPCGGSCESMDYDVNNLFLAHSSIPLQRLGIGLAFYGYTSTGGGQTGPYQSYGVTPTWAQKIYSYIINNYDTSGATYDTTAHAAWIPISGGWLNWNSPQSMLDDVAWAKTNAPGGWIIWYLGADDFPAASPKQPLLFAIDQALNGLVRAAPPAAGLLLF